MIDAEPTVHVSDFNALTYQEWQLWPARHCPILDSITADALKQGPCERRYGSWAVCFTYGAWFGTKALRAMGHTMRNCDAQARAAHFLLEHQRADGGWGESYLSCQDKVYSQLEGASALVYRISYIAVLASVYLFAWARQQACKRGTPLVAADVHPAANRKCERLPVQLLDLGCLEAARGCRQQQ